MTDRQLMRSGNASAVLALAAVLLLAAPSSAAVKDVQIVVSVSLSDSTVAPGGSFTSNFSVKNTGDTDPGPFTFQLNLRVGRWTVGNPSDGCSRPNDFDIVCSLSGLAPGARFSTSVVVTLGPDAVPGQIYNVGAAASNSSTNFGPGGGDVKSITVGAAPAPPPPPPPPGPSTLSVALRGSGAGTVISSPAGINCGSSCALQFAHGTSVTLTAAPSPGSVFSGWGDACAAAAQTSQCTVTMDADAAASATFDLAPATTTTAAPPPPAPTVCTVPRVIGMTVAAARQRLTRADCRLGAVTARRAKRSQVGRVIAQHPAAGEYLEARGKVAIVIGKP